MAAVTEPQKVERKRFGELGCTRCAHSASPATLLRRLPTRNDRHFIAAFESARADGQSFEGSPRMAASGSGLPPFDEHFDFDGNGEEEDGAEPSAKRAKL